MRLRINGEQREVEAQSIYDLLRSMGIDDPSGVAVALDREVIPRSQWGTTGPKDGQAVEVVMAVQGG